LSPDPAHQTPSPYLYCANNPVNYTDPTGEEFIFLNNPHASLHSDNNIADKWTILNSPPYKVQSKFPSIMSSQENVYQIPMGPNSNPIKFNATRFLHKLDSDYT